MKRKTIGELIFWGAVSLALALYGLTVPEGLPWNESTRLALAYLGETVRLPTMPHPIWGFYVKVFGGATVLSVSLAALAAGLLGALVNRYFGWRFAASAALAWIFLPGVWNRAITGERGVCLAAMAVVAAWVLNAAILRVTRKARALRKVSPALEGGDGGANALSGGTREAKRGRLNRIAGWLALGMAGLFAAASLTLHDYKLGEAASVFAKGVVEAAGDRVIVMNGVCDEQVARQASGIRYPVPGTRHPALSLRNDDAYRTNLVAWVKCAWPTETNLWVAASVSAQAFVDAATKAHSERFYLMNGASATREQWERRWEAFKPYLASGDPFVRVGRRLFGYEGNGIANAMLDGVSGKAGRGNGSTGDDSTAWRLYRRVYEEITPGNVSALLNMNEMIRRGYAVSGDEAKRVREKLDAFFRDANNRRHAQRIVRASGPVRADPALMEKMAAEAKRRIAAKVAAGEQVKPAPEVLSLVEWNNEMVALMNKGELVKAGRVARAILSNPTWREFIPANAVMGTVASAEGDYVASERFFHVATDTTNKVALAVLNDYADTLMHLGKLAEAEKMARRATAESDGQTDWICRLTLAEVLMAKKIKAKAEGERDFLSSAVTDACSALDAEIRALLKSILQHAPREARDKIRRDHRAYLR